MREVMIGWVIWDSETQMPYRPTHGQDWRKHKVPPRIYTSEKRAGPGAVPVYVKVDEDETYNN